MHRDCKECVAHLYGSFDGIYFVMKGRVGGGGGGGGVPIVFFLPNSKIFYFQLMISL